MSFDEVLQLRRVICFPARYCEQINGIVLKLSDQDRAATMILAQHVTHKERGKHKDGDQGNFLTHRNLTPLRLIKREEEDER